MTIVFERDADGLLHQVNMTLEEISAAGRNITLMSMQCFVLFTPEQEKQRAAELAEAKAREDARLAEIAKKQEAQKAEQEKLTVNALLLEAAKKEAETQKDQALSLALGMIKDQGEKIAALQATLEASLSKNQSS